MDNELDSTFVGQPSLVSRGLQGFAFAVAGILLIFAITETRKLGAPNLPTAWIFAEIGVTAATLVLQWPSL